jgi:hypothetical protein
MSGHCPSCGRFHHGAEWRCDYCVEHHETSVFQSPTWRDRFVDKPPRLVATKIRDGAFSLRILDEPGNVREILIDSEASLTLFWWLRTYWKSVDEKEAALAKSRDEERKRHGQEIKKNEI